MCKFNLFFCINILITNINPYMRQLLLQITVWEVKGARKGKTVHDYGGLGTNCKSVFDRKLTRTTTPKILSLSPLTTKEHPYKVKKKNLQSSFFIINEKVKNRVNHFFGPSSFIRSRKQKAVVYNAHNCCILYLDYNLKFHMLCNKAKTASQKNS